MESADENFPLLRIYISIRPRPTCSKQIFENFFLWSGASYCCDRKPERQVRKASHRDSKQQ